MRTAKHMRTRAEVLSTWRPLRARNELIHRHKDIPSPEGPRTVHSVNFQLDTHLLRMSSPLSEIHQPCLAWAPL
jgi:hypothetical protein